jgi:hypothetical protein
MPRHPYPDSAVFYALLVVILVGVTALTGGDVRRSVYIGVALFVVATGYSWCRWRDRERRENSE